MSPSSFFLLSFTGPIVAGAIMSAGAWYSRDWLIDHRVMPLPVLLIVFIFTWVVMRKLIHSFVAVHCPKCKTKTAYEMDAVACRFRCRVCWKEF